MCTRVHVCPSASQGRPRPPPPHPPPPRSRIAPACLPPCLLPGPQNAASCRAIGLHGYEQRVAGCTRFNYLNQVMVVTMMILMKTTMSPMMIAAMTHAQPTCCMGGPGESYVGRRGAGDGARGAGADRTNQPTSAFGTNKGLIAAAAPLCPPSPTPPHSRRSPDPFTVLPPSPPQISCSWGSRMPLR